MTSIGDSAFYNCSSLTSVTIPEGVTSIGNWAFEDCSSLTSVTIPEGVTTIGGRAFEGCSSLVITVSSGNASYASLDGCLFNKDYSTLLAGPGVKDDYVIPSSVTTIGDYAFRYCRSLTSVTIPEGVTSIGDRAFEDCSSLTSVTIPASVTTIGDSEFKGVAPKVLTATRVPSGMSKEKLTSVTIPKGVTSIGDGAFEDCGSLTSVTIPSSVTSIGKDAFYYCWSLTSVTIPEGVTSIGERAFFDCNLLTSVTIPEGMTSIGDEAFEDCNLLTSVKIPSSVTSVGKRAFAFCNSLTSVTISSSVTSIGSFAFTGVAPKVLTAAWVPSGMSTENLTTVMIPEGVTSIGDYAFSYCSVLTTVTFLGSPCEAQDTAFPEGTTGIYSVAFAAAWEAVIVDGRWHRLIMTRAEANSYTIVYNANGGTGEMAGTPATYDQAVALTENSFSREGYTFKGWATTSTGTAVYEDGAEVRNLTDKVDGVVTLYAAWEANRYAITYNANGGTGELANTPATYNQSITLSVNGFSREGYTFTGWATEPSGAAAYAPGDAVTNLTAEAEGTVTLYAAWEANRYAIAYNANGGEGEMASTPATYDQAIALAVNTFTREGYTFTGWATEPSGAAVYAPGEEVTNLTAEADGTVSLYAVWEANSYTIAYDASGGDGEMESTPATYDQAVALAANGFTREGYTFTGWATEPAGATVYAPGEEVTNLTAEADGTVTLCAAWEANRYAIAYNANGGEGEMASTPATYDQAVVLAANGFLREGYTFKGWATTSMGTVVYGDRAEVRNLTAVADGTVTFYAVWEGVPYAIAYNANGGLGDMVATQATYGEAINLSANAFTREGYTFKGWATTSTGAVAYGNGGEVRNLTAEAGGVVTLYAIWEINHYTIAYNANGGEGEIEPTAATYGETVTLRFACLTRAKYLFKGWALTAAGGVVYGDGAEVSNLTDEADGVVTLYAVWEKRDEIHLRVAVAKQRFPWNGVVDIEVTLEDEGLLTEYPQDYAFRLRAIDQVSQEVYVPSAEALTLTVPTSGVQQLTWDVARDYPSLISRELSFTVEVVESEGDEVSETQATYLVIDLSGGSEASTYSVTPLAAMPTEGWGEEYKTNKLVLRRITPGTFMMGSPDTELGRDSDETQHQVTLTQPYYIGVFEVTQRQWELVMGNRPSYFSNNAYYAMRPVECVSYNDICGSSLGAQWPSSDAVDASSFLGKLRARTGCEQWTLPTEAQWEYACRAGTTTALNSGKDLTSTTSCSNLNEVGRYRYNGGESYSASSTTVNGTATVGSYQPNEWGLYDMHGNVWEWCRDWFKHDLGTEAAIDPCGSTSGSSHALRGCCWHDSANGCRSAARDYISTTSQEKWDGFRLVCTADLMATQEEGEGIEAVVTSIQTATITYDATVASRVIGASEVSALPYNPAWAGGDTVRITINGELWHTDTQAGEKAWAPEESGYYLLLLETLKDGASIETRTATVQGTLAQQVSTPILTVREGNRVIVSTTTEGATLHYTVDGSEPMEQSPITPGLLSLSGSGTLKVRAMKEGWVPSEIVSYERDSSAEGNLESLLTYGSVPWQEVTLNGTQVWKSGAISDGGTSAMSLTLTGPGTLTFRWKVSSESNYDWLSFLCDGTQIQRISGTQDWQTITYAKTDEATATFTWQYTKDRSVSSGSDCGWVDEIIWEGAGPLQAACSLYDSDSQLYYSIANSTVTILSYAQLPEDGHLVIPVEIAGLPVTAIGDYAFTNCASLVSVTLSTSVTTVGTDAFRGVAPETLVAAFLPSGMSKASLTSLIIPDGVTSIASRAFSDCSALISVEIPVSVTSIGYYAFSGVAPEVLIAASVPNGMSSKKLISVTIPEGVTSIGSFEFRGCSSLTSVTIPASVTAIGSSAFAGCSSLMISVNVNNPSYASQDGCLFNKAYTALLAAPSVAGDYVIPANVTSIGSFAFEGCSSLTSVTIPEGVTSIGSSAFSGCSSLTSVTIPEGVTSIGGYAFEDCSSLTSVTIPSSVTTISDYAFAYCSSLTSVTIPSSVTTIGDRAFSGCNALTSMTILASVTEIGEGAFTGVAPKTLVASCVPSGISKEKLTSVTIPEGVTSIGGRAFEGCSSLTTVTIPSSVTSIGNYAFSGCSSLTTVTIPEGVTSIGSYAFHGCSSLRSVTIPSSVTSIGSSAFYGCSSLTSVEIPASVTSIGSSAFYGCSSLTSVTIPSSVTSIGDNTFRSCSSLTSVTIPSSVTSIGSLAFCGCSSLTSVTISEGVTSIGYCAFEGCSSLTTVTIPEGVTSIGGSAFEGCSSLTSVTIPASVTSIGDQAFVGVAPKTLVASCVPSGMSKEKLTSVTIPEGVTSIGSSTFRGCSSLTSVTIPEGVTSIGSSAFRGCSSLTSVEIPASVTSIGNYAFSDCTSLTSVTIPASVTSIGSSAFYGCSSLTSVEIPEGITALGANLFTNCTSLTSILIPEGVTAIGAQAFSGCRAVTTVVIPNGVVTIGEGAFTGVAPTTLVAPLLPSGMSRANLTEVTLTTAAAEIPEAVFAGNTALRTITLPAGVTAIGARAFEGCSALERVEIPASVTEIGEGAFTGVAPTTLVAPFLPSGMSTANLTEVTLTTAAAEIPEAVFAGNEILRSIVLPAGVTSIGARAFEGCSALERVEIPASVTEIGARAFAECTGLTEVVFAEGLAKVGDEAFWGCSAVEEMVLPASLTTLGKRVFTGCNRVLVAEGNRNYKSVDGVLFSANNEWLLHFPVYRGGEYATPVNVHFVGEEAFMGNSALNFVYLADITTLEPRAFKDCGGLIYCFATDGLLTIQANAFENATSLRAFTVPATVSLLQVGAFKNCTSLNLVAFRGTVPTRTGMVFSGMNLDQMRSTYPTEYAATWEAALNGSLMWDGLKMVADSYYTGTSGNYKYRALGGEAIITGSTIPLSGAVRLPMMLDDYLVTGIDARAFVTSTGLTDITFPRSLLSIGDYAFAFCTKLQSVTFEGCPLTKGSTPTQPFPANTTAVGNYPAELEEAWNQVIEGGYYYGLRMGLVEVLAILGGGEGEVRGTGTYHIGETVTLEAVPAEKQRFVQWMFLDGTTSTENPLTFTADEACYVMVTFEKDPAAIVFSKITYENLMGATHRNPETYEEGTEYTFTTPSEVTGYTFQGWQPAAINSAMTGDQTIRATWKANSYTVIYASNGGMGSMENTTAVYGTPFSLSANAFTRVGYTFAGWATSATGGALYADGAEVSNLTATANGTVTLYAVWVGNGYTIAYHANGGNGTTPATLAH